MPMIELPNGQNAEFPDTMSLDDIKSAISKKFPPMQKSTTGTQQPALNPRIEEFKKATGIGSTPFSNLRDLLGGVAKAGQNIGELAAPLRKYIPESMKVFPDVNAQKVISSENPNPLLQMIGQYAPSAMFGGALGQAIGRFAPSISSALGGSNLLGQAAGQGLYGATQAPEGERLKQGLEEGLGTYAGGKLLPAAYQGAKNVLNYLQPGKAAENFIQKIGGTMPRTEQIIPWDVNSHRISGIEQRIPSDINTRRIAETLKTSVENQMASALPHKQKVLNEIGNTDISELPGFNIEKVARLFNKDLDNIGKNQVNSFKNALNDYKNDQNFERFVNRSENILKSEIPKEKLNKLEDMISQRKTQYESNEDIFNDYDKRLRNVHNEFMKDKSLSNADRLIQELNDRIFSYKDLQAVRNLPPTDAEKLKDFESVKKDLIHDMDTHMESKSPELQKEYQTYREKWAKNVETYHSDPILRKISQGQTQGITPSELKNVFSHPTKEVKKILGDLPDETKNYIIFNELTNIKPNDAKGLVNALNSLEQHKGYSEMITPEMKEIKNKLNKQLTFQKIGKATGIGALALGSLGGLGYGINKLRNAFNQ